MIRGVDQDWALAAARALPDPLTKEQRTRFRTLRTMLRTSGLATTYAFIAAKSDSHTPVGLAYDQTRALIEEHLADADLGLLRSDTRGARGILAQLGDLSPAAYLLATRTASGLLDWLARLAEAVLPTTSDGSSTQASGRPEELSAEAQHA